MIKLVRFIRGKYFLCVTKGASLFRHRFAVGLPVQAAVQVCPVEGPVRDDDLLDGVEPPGPVVVLLVNTAEYSITVL
jgi:hypothetical protein